MSSSERLLILGATGQLGTDLVHAAAAAGVDHVGAGHEDIDVTQGHSVAAGIARYRPTIVINTAAFHRVDACEHDPHQAYLVNTVGALLIARVSSLFGAAGPRNKSSNFVEAILKQAGAGGPVRVVSDQWMTPTYTLDAARAIVRLA